MNEGKIPAHQNQITVTSTNSGKAHFSGYSPWILFVPLENSTTESHRVSGASLGRGRPGPSGTQLLVVAVCACALHAQLQKTNVEINVYFPGGFLRSDSKVFLRSENNNEVRVISNDTQLKINVFGKYVTCI